MTQKKQKIVIALGGNALQDANSQPTAEAQLEVIKKTCKYVADIVENDYQIVLAHGNGPQVGRILLASETARDVTPPMPFDVVGAMSQGYIGYQLQQALRAELAGRGKNVPVVTLVTQVVVNDKDPAFQNPTKPIGAFYSEVEAKKLAAEKGYVMKEDAGRGWRRVVASPRPKRIVEIETVKQLCENSIVISAGGGGVPVVELPEEGLKGVAAVIDKDFAAELLAEQIDADILLILTAVENVAVNYNKPDQMNLKSITAAKAEEYISKGHFAPGSMLPKVEAAVKFVKSSPNKKAVIASLYNAINALEGNSGTIITLS